ncbi:MAG: hypothetical protein COV71_02020 [Candidatus Omnitrophica bacterium CG11_big_fil_rev_8_21_14_0_20_41_12]|nr:MAG: hypothetical protein COV71_02020 [Candidatus Omnitrophica bacterium CG11_big_fil_rev_8_21_14_0_20_41_12]
MGKLNCWEYKKCGREPGGAKADKLGVCPASTEKRTNGINCGKNGGRACWAIAGTVCGGKVRGSFAVELASCMECEFHKLVMSEEANKFVLIEDILLKLKN